MNHTITPRFCVSHASRRPCELYRITRITPSAGRRINAALKKAVESVARQYGVDIALENNFCGSDGSLTITGRVTLGPPVPGVFKD